MAFNSLCQKSFPDPFLLGSEARVLEDRLAGLLTPRILYLDAMGCRIHYLALERRFDNAVKLLQAMLPLTKGEMASPWQRFKFYEGCMRAMATSGNQRNTLPSEVAESEIMGAREELISAFAIRSR